MDGVRGVWARVELTLYGEIADPREAVGMGSSPYLLARIYIQDEVRLKYGPPALRSLVITLPPRSAMAPKRARTAAAAASASSSSQPAGATTKLTLHGGVPHHPALAGLWRDKRLTDFALSAEGVEFKAHRVALASSSKYFLNLFESGMRDAADATHALEGIRPKALEVLLAFIYEGKCQIDEGQLTDVLEASARLVVDDLKEACAGAIGARLAPSNALNVWRLADVFTLPALEKAAVEAALRGFEELPAEQATGAEVVALVQEDRLVARSEEAVFQWVRRWWEAGARPEAELLAVLRHVRFAAMAAAFLRETVRAWPALGSAEAGACFSMQCCHSRRHEGGAALGLWAPPDLPCGRRGRGRKAQHDGAVRPAGRLVDAAGRHGGPSHRRSAASLSMASSTPWAAVEPMLRSSTRRRCTTRRPMAGSLWPR